MLQRIIAFTCCLLFASIVIGCSSEEPTPQGKTEQQKQTTKPKAKLQPPVETPHIEGTITKLEGGKILVEEDPSQPEVTQKAQISLDTKTKFWVPAGKKYNPGKQAELKQGMKVKVWYTGIVMDTYPVQSTGGHIVYTK